MSACDAEEHTHPNKKSSPTHTSTELNREYVRAENEDDDGYDPYSDRKEYTPLFERDPWA